MKYVAVLTTHECALMVTIQNTIPKAHGNNETSSNPEIKFEISYTSNLLTIFIIKKKKKSLTASPIASLHTHTSDHMCKYYLLCQCDTTGMC